jgi:orotate phosphoribosyltransferase
VVEGAFTMYCSAHRWPSKTMVSDPFTVIGPATAAVEVATAVAKQIAPKEILMRRPSLM